MKKVISNIIGGAVALAAVISFWSCTNENPFDNDGTGTVNLHTVVNSIVTRADENPNQDLEDKCVVYISKFEEHGKDGKPVKKWVGLQNVDTQITLKAGSYVAEAWTGDSVTASWDKKFYRGYEPFEVTKGSSSNVVINCKIKNVVASINAETLNPELMKDDYSIKIKNSRGELEFTKDNLDKRAYFMMPNGDDKLHYEIKGTKADGKPFSQNGDIKVEPAHRYIFNLLPYNPGDSGDNSGYVFIKINIKDEAIDDDNVLVFTRPTISGEDFDIKNQLNFSKDEDIPELGLSVKICGDHLKDIILEPGDVFTWNDFLGLDNTNNDLLAEKDPVNFSQLFNLSENDPILVLFKEKGIEYKAPVSNENTKIETAYFNFSKDFFLNLAKDDKKYQLKIRVSDDHNPESVTLLRVARSEDAIETPDPIEVFPLGSDDFLSIKSYSANLKYKISTKYEGEDTPGLEYSKANDDNWTFVPAQSPSGKPRKVSTRSENDNIIRITGLEEGTTYKYRACCGEFHGTEYTFTTESKFIIPNASMEDWSPLSSNSKVMLPSADGTVSFWDSGNHGSATMSKTLTQGSNKMFHSGAKSAELISQFVGIGSIGKFAAGNLFAGTYKETKGTNGVIEFGRPFNGSHPKALSLWANYRPGKANSKGAGSYIKEGDTDKAQIYVAISTTTVTVDTSNAATLFNPEAQNILAYGEVTWDSDFGPNGALQQKTIELKYNDRANKDEAKYLIIVCSASKYGDYFCGGEGSTMYLDDFELIYE